MKILLDDEINLSVEPPAGSMLTYKLRHLPTIVVSAYRWPDRFNPSGEPGQKWLTTGMTFWTSWGYLISEIGEPLILIMED